ncbi:hypothetical protein CU097_010630 [Rhizopus azygosporus]|uniref:Major facilitator superfamily (MFS) profile domain-containing protein n=1 Tax=Rhizopus azygosporus TaxID=86630 RepID=A0A367KC68_RHIAZ|nr:hypothetical protein CU097_010630 [Rhizopus azygosporus]
MDAIKSFSKRKPFLLNIRSSKLYVLATVALSLFTDMVTESIIIPIVPFIIDAIERGVDMNSSHFDIYNSQLSNPESVSKDSGTLLALFSVGIIVGSLAFGYLGDRIKHRQILMVAGLFGLLGSTLLFMFAQKFWELLFARLLQGISSACVWTLGMCLMADRFPIEELGTQMGRLMVFHSTGLLAGPPIGALFEAKGYRAPFIFCIGIAAADLVMRLFLIESKRHPPGSFKTEEKQAENHDTSTNDTIVSEASDDQCKVPSKNSVTYWRLLKQPRLLNGLLMIFTYSFVLGALEATISVRMVTEWGMNSKEIGLLFLAEIFPTFISEPLSGIITDKYGPKMIVYPFWLLCGASTMLLGIPNKNTRGGIAPLIVILAVSAFSSSACLTPVVPEIAHVVRSQNEDDGDDGMGRSYVPFVIDAIDRGVSPEETIADSYYGSSYSYFSSAAKKTGFLLAAYAVGMIFGSLIIGYLGK